MALNMHKPVNMARLHAKYGKELQMTKIAQMAHASYPAAREWVEAFNADRFGLTESDVRFLAEEFGIIPKEEE